MTTDGARALLRRLGTFVDGFAGGFSRRPQREAASTYVAGLFNDSARKSMQAMHGRLSTPQDYQALQHFITHSPWDARSVWTHLRTLVPVRTGVLALDDTGFPKQGTHSVGVRRQYCGALGKFGNVRWPSGVRVRVRPTHPERWLLCERSGDVRKFYLLNLAPTATVKELVTLARARWPIEQPYRELKDELGSTISKGGVTRAGRTTSC